MRITKIKIRNLLGIREYEADGKDRELSGKNGVGKSAVIDAIRYALTNKAGRELVITRGETEGEVLIETDSGLSVHRKVRTEKANYKSIRQAGEKDEKTEAFLREIFTELQLNPVEFSKMDEKEQNRIILDLIDFKWDLEWVRAQFGEIPPQVNFDQNILCVLHDIQAEEGYYFQTRQNINRDIRNKLAFIEDIGKTLPAGYNAQEWRQVSLGALFGALTDLRAENQQIERSRAIVQGKEGKLRAIEADLEIKKGSINSEAERRRTAMQGQIQDLEHRIANLKRDIDTVEKERLSDIEIAILGAKNKAAALEGEVKEHEAKAQAEIKDTTAAQAAAEEAERMKSYLNEYDRLIVLQKEAEDLRLQSEDLTQKIEKARTLPGEILATAKIPIPGLEIKDGKPVINGLPISNLSDGEKMELCVHVAVAREGSLTMILMDGIERLASERREQVYKMLKERGAQFVATRTSDDDKLTVVEL